MGQKVYVNVLYLERGCMGDIIGKKHSHHVHRTSKYHVCEPSPYFTLQIHSSPSTSSHLQCWNTVLWLLVRNEPLACPLRLIPVIAGLICCPWLVSRWQVVLILVAIIQLSRMFTVIRAVLVVEIVFFDDSGQPLIRLSGQRIRMPWC